jgi:hypothetical protein
MGGGETAGPPGLAGDAELANPELFTDPPDWALRRHRNVTGCGASAPRSAWRQVFPRRAGAGGSPQSTTQNRQPQRT